MIWPFVRELLSFYVTMSCASNRRVTRVQERHASAVRPRSYQDESYLHGFLGTVDDLQKAGVLQDVVLEVEDRRFPCHRLVLSAASPYFRAMFTNDMAESRQKTVVLQGLDAGMFGEILSYIYSGNLHVSLDKVQPLYQAADLLQLDYVKYTCSNYMAMNVERSTCVDLYKFADVFSVETVRKRCLQWMYKNFAEVACSEEFCSLLTEHQLTEIISHDELDVQEETTVWEAVVKWVQHSREDRLHHLPSILPHIRFNLLTSDDTAAILEHPLVREDPGSSEVIRNVVQKGDPNQKPRFGMTTEMALLYNQAPGSEEFLFMNPQEGKYISCSYKPEDLSGFSAITVTSDNNIYILQTGESEDENQLSLSKYNHARNVWEHECMSSVSKGPDYNLKFCEQLLIEVDQILYYIVLDDFKDRRLHEMRKYNRHMNLWQDCSKLQLDYVTYYSAVVSCDSHIYFLTTKEVHRYEPRQDRWCKRSQLLEPNFEFGTAVAMGTEIFCTDFALRLAMVYNTQSDYWQKLQGLSNPRNLVIFDLSLFVMENQLHVWSTWANDEDEEEYNVYVYDRSTDVWRDLKVTLPDTSKEYCVYGPQCPVARIYLPYLTMQDKAT
ncbi:kelch repeat and BTB domain-containing protein 2-like [Branchiostoma lanceolatum]|uniref:kelch repeat and BTB domain-containing protein 2-like n=1 Tax=Branchiostoma lanceolatum TaxID=7740 RepID=UPI0034572523